MLTRLAELHAAERIYQLELRALLRAAGRGDPEADAVRLNREAQELATTTAASLSDVRREQRLAINRVVDTPSIDAFVRWRLGVPARTT